MCKIVWNCREKERERGCVGWVQLLLLPQVKMINHLLIFNSLWITVCSSLCNFFQLNYNYFLFLFLFLYLNCVFFKVMVLQICITESWTYSLLWVYGGLVNSFLVLFVVLCVCLCGLCYNWVLLNFLWGDFQGWLLIWRVNWWMMCVFGTWILGLLHFLLWIGYTDTSMDFSVLFLFWRTSGLWWMDYVELVILVACVDKP